MSNAGYKIAECCYNFSFLGYIFFLGHLYYTNFFGLRFRQILLAITSIGFLIQVLILYEHGIQHISKYSIILLSLCYLSLALLWFYAILQIETNKSIFDFPEFYYSAALLIWSVIFLFRALAKEQLNKIDPNFLSHIGMLFTSINILFVILFIFGLRCMKRQLKLN